MHNEAIAEVAAAAHRMVLEGQGEMTPPMARALGWVCVRFSGAADFNDVNIAVDANVLTNIMVKGGWTRHEAHAVAKLIVEKRFGEHPNHLPAEDIYAEYEADMAKLQEMPDGIPPAPEGGAQPSAVDG